MTPLLRNLMAVSLCACTQSVPIATDAPPPAPSAPPPTSSFTPYTPKPEPTSRPDPKPEEPIGPIPSGVPCSFEAISSYTEPGGIVHSAHVTTCSDGAGVFALVTGNGPARVVTMANESTAVAAQTYPAAGSAPEGGLGYARLKAILHGVFAADATHVYAIGGPPFISETSDWREAVLSTSEVKEAAIGPMHEVKGKELQPDAALSTARGVFVLTVATESFTTDSEALVATRSAEDGTWTFVSTPIPGALGAVFAATPAGAPAIAYSVRLDKTSEARAVLPGGTPVKLYDAPDTFRVASAVFDSETATSGTFASSATWPGARLAVVAGGAATLTSLGEITAPCTYPSGQGEDICGSTCTESGTTADIPSLARDANGRVFAVWTTQTVTRNRLSEHGCALGPIGCGCSSKVKSSSYGPLVVHVAERTGTAFVERWSHALEGLPAASTTDRGSVALDTGCADGKLHVLVRKGVRNAVWLVLTPA